MKKHLALLLAATLICAMIFTLTSCKEEPTSITTSDGEEIPIIDTDTDENAPAPAPAAPGSSYSYARSSLTLSGDPVFSDGKLTLNFNEAAIYSESTECYIGVQSIFEAESIKATPDMTAAVDMYTGDGAYTGIVLVPSSEILPGTYNFVVSIGTYVVETFEYTVE